MAIAYPANPELVTTSEQEVFEKLLTLSDSWHVYSNLRQHIVLFERISRGELDFVLTHPHYGIVLIEVKGYGVFCEDGEWFRIETNQLGKSNNKKTKDPYSQVEDARGNLIDFLFQNEQNLKPVIKDSDDIAKMVRSIHTLVIFPYLPDYENLGMKASESNTLTQKDLNNISKYFEKNIKNKNFGEFKGMQEKIKSLLLPSVNTAPMRGITKNIEKQMIASTLEQSVILNAIAENNNFVSVTGPAGSGKTVLAGEVARKFAESGSKVLLLCYNQNLSKYLKQIFSEYETIEVNSLFGFFSNININLKDLGTSNLTPQDAAPIIAEVMNENFDKFNTDFDVLIIDEAQDFSPLFWPTFELLTETKKWFIFSDIRQAITHSHWKLPELQNQSWLKFPLTKYLRSTKEISEKVLSVYEDNYDATAIKGIEPKFVEIKESGWKDALVVLSETLKELFEVEKYDTSQVQILIPHSRYMEEVEQCIYKPNQKVGGIKGINIESIYKFKGLEKEVVVMVVPNIESLYSENTTDIKSLVYVGMSRATSMLIVIGDNEVKQLANWNS